MKRIASVIGLEPEHREEYLAYHRAVWPEVLATLTECNVHNYSIYRHGDLLFAYFEYTGDDYEADMAKMAADPATQRWWSVQEKLQTRLPGTPDGDQWLEIPEIFHLD